MAPPHGGGAVFRHTAAADPAFFDAAVAWRPPAGSATDAANVARPTLVVLDRGDDAVALKRALERSDADDYVVRVVDAPDPLADDDEAGVGAGNSRLCAPRGPPEGPVEEVRRRLGAPRGAGAFPKVPSRKFGDVRARRAFPKFGPGPTRLTAQAGLLMVAWLQLYLALGQPTTGPRAREMWVD